MLIFNALIGQSLQEANKVGFPWFLQYKNTTATVTCFSGGNIVVDLQGFAELCSEAQRLLATGRWRVANVTAEQIQEDGFQSAMHRKCLAR